MVQWQNVATSRLTLYSSAGRTLGELPLPGLGSVGGLSARADSNRIYYSFTSFLTPASIYRCGIDSARTQTVFRPTLTFDASGYQTRQVFYRSKDGTRVPMFIVTRKGLRLDGSHPTILYGYGGFDITITPSFSPVLPVWLELGGIYAVPNLRGGAVYGETWHRAGMLAHKRWLLAYSPLQNIHPGACYPPTLITTSWDDDRVVPMHECKFAARMQRAQGCANPILLYTTDATSHVYMPTDKQIEQTADVWAFEAYSLGITAPPARDAPTPTAH